MNNMTIDRPSDNRIDRTIDVANGKANVKFFFWRYMSPGSLPNQGNFPPRMNKAPTAIRNAPNSTNVFPNKLTFSI